MKIKSRNRVIVMAGLFLVFVNVANTQDQMKLDSLLVVIGNTHADSVKVKSYLDLSTYYYSYNYNNALKYAREAKRIASESGLKKWEARTNNIIGNIFLSIGDYKESSKHYFNALRYYESSHDSLNIIRMYTNLGALYDRLEEYDKALSYYFKVIDLFGTLRKEKQKDYPLTSLYNNIANIYQTKKDTSSALQYYRKSLSYAKQTNNKTALGIVLNNLGKLYLIDLQQPDKGIIYLLEGLKVREQLGDKAEIARSMIFLVEFYYRQGNIKKALQYAEKALMLAREIGAVDLQSKAHEQLSVIQEMQGKPGEALENYKLHKLYNDSIQKQFARSEIERLQLQYEFENNEKMLEERTKQIKTRYFIVVMTLVIGLVIAVLIASLIRIRARQTEFRQKALLLDVESKSKELTTNVMYLVRKNELINHIAERLLAIEPQLSAESQGIIHGIVLELQKEGDADTWKEFELRFNQVHLDFYNRLRTLYPSITPSDEKLCAFLRLNMSTKDISAITHQSPKSIEVARARLRKKLNLTNTHSNLVSHLLNL